MRASDEEERAANEAAFREDPIQLTAKEYELIRGDPTCFVIVSGHPTDGEVVSDRGDHMVVRKTGRGGALAAETDPRKEEP